MKSQTDQKNFFKNVLVADAETTGIAFGTPDPSIGQQCVSWGIIVADTVTFKTIEELYVEIKWNDISKEARKKDSSFGKSAEEIHGLTYKYLEKME